MRYDLLRLSLCSLDLLVATALASHFHFYCLFKLTYVLLCSVMLRIESLLQTECTYVFLCYYLYLLYYKTLLINQLISLHFVFFYMLYYKHTTQHAVFSFSLSLSNTICKNSYVYIIVVKKQKEHTLL